MQKYLCTLFFIAFILLASVSSAQAEDAKLPNGDPFTIDNLKKYKSTPEGKNLSVREGAKMSESMNFDDCFDDSYQLCMKLFGPCKVNIDLKIGSFSLKVPSAGIKFKYWEPNAMVETICSKGDSYYKNKMNLSSRMIGSSHLLGEEATINGMPAEKCVETIRKGGGMENASATPRYFNETHVWGIGIISRFQSSANILEATVSSICGYAGKIGGLMEKFGNNNSNDRQSIGNGNLQQIQSFQDMQKGFDSIKNAGDWMKNGFDINTAVTEGLQGFMGINFSDSIATAAAVGLDAMNRMKQNSKKEVRPNKLCEQKFQLEKTINKGNELETVYEKEKDTKEGFTIGTFTDNYDDGGICPIKAGTGHTLTYNDESVTGVSGVAWREQVPCNNNGLERWETRSTCYASGPTTSGPRISQVQVAGYYPACKGYVNSDVQVWPIYQKEIQGFSATDETLLGYRTTAPHIIAREGNSLWGRPYYYTTLSEAKAAVAPVENPASITCTRKYNWNWSDTWEADTYTTTCTAKKNTIYIEEYDHVKKLNAYMTDSSLQSVRESASEAEVSLESVNKRITDLGGDCDANGEPVGNWGEALVESALNVAALKGMQAGMNYLQGQPAYSNLQNSASSYLSGVETKMGESSDNFLSGLTSKVGEKGAARAEGALGNMAAVNTDSFLQEAFQDQFPEMMQKAQAGGMASDMGNGMSDNESMDYFQLAMDAYKMATYDGALRQAAIGMASSYDPTGLWPSFMSEKSAPSWRGKKVDRIAQLKGMIGIVGHLGCSLASIGTDIGKGFMKDGTILKASEDWIGCVGSWGPLEPQTGFVYHRDSMIARALAGYRGYRLAVSLRSLLDHEPKKAGAPMKINMDFPHKTKCFIPGTADLRWESKNGLNPLEAVPNLINSVKNIKVPFDENGNRTADAKAMQIEDEGSVFTYWKKSKCCLYVVKWYRSYIPDACFKVKRYY